MIEAMAARLQARAHHLAKVVRGGSEPAVTRFGFGCLIGHGYCGLREFGQRSVPRRPGGRIAGNACPDNVTRIPPPAR